MPSLGIVIPAYKKAFIDQTLQSLVNQTCQDFKVYIGNDAGDTQIQNVVDGFKRFLDIDYIYFEENLGGKSLVQAWHRCLSLTKGEEWLWVLPDDDFIDKYCVESFFSTLKEDGNFDLFRFSSALTDQNGLLIKKNVHFPAVESSYFSFMEKISYNRSSTLAEYIFSRRIFETSGGFPELPLAWGSDDAAWYIFGAERGIKTIPKGLVFLRQSSLNISSDYTKLGNKKLFALVLLFNGLMKLDTFRKDKENYSQIYNFEKLSQFFIFNEMRQMHIKLKLKDIYKLGLISSKFWSGGAVKNMYRFWYNYKKFIKQSTY